MYILYVLFLFQSDQILTGYYNFLYIKLVYVFRCFSGAGEFVVIGLMYREIQGKYNYVNYFHISPPHRTILLTPAPCSIDEVVIYREILHIKTASTPSQPANPGGSKLHSTEKAALIHPAPVEEEAAEPAPVEAAAQQAVGTATTASVSRSVASTSAAQTHTAIEQGPGMVKHDDSSQKRDLDQVEHTDSMPKKTKLDGSTQQVPGSPAPATDLVQSVDTNSGTDRLAVDNSMLSASSQRQDTESEQQKKAAPALALNMAVEDKLAMAAARRQQMEVDQATERTKDNEPVASSSTSSTDQSKKRCAKVDLQLTRRRIVAVDVTLACADPTRRIWTADRSAQRPHRQHPLGPRT